MPVRRLPSRASLDHLKHQAKDLLRLRASEDAGAAQRIREFHPGFERATDREIFAAGFKLHDALLTIAREHGFLSWARLKAHLEKPAMSNRLDVPHHERIEDPTFRRAVELIDAGDAATLGRLLQEHPGLTRQRLVFEGGNYFRNPSLLAFIAENPVRHGKLPENIVEVARTLLDAGADQLCRDEALGLVATGSVPRACGVQVPLIDLLCEYGASPGSALIEAVLHGELAAADALIARGAPVTLPVAAAFGRLAEVERQLASADGAERHLALALASQYGRVEVAGLLLDAGEDPSRYNPVGGHCHSTPLHQAAYEGNEPLVKLLVERGANVDRRDTLWDGTPADWAQHGGKTDLEQYLRALEGKQGRPEGTTPG
ncbi:MAG TPA: ankyrin repeat domain-containing protein [Acidobacteriaceae bacterium]